MWQYFHYLCSYKCEDVNNIMKKTFLILILLLVGLNVNAQKERIMNKPFIDNRQLHWGFFLGMNFMDMELTNNGRLDSETGEQWYAECTKYNPGFSVGVLGAKRLNRYLEIRLTPTLHFGQKFLKMRENISNRDTIQNMQTYYIATPISIKAAAPRYNNFRPYFTFGVSPTFCLNRFDQEAIKPKMFDLYFEVGLGCDLYLPYFKLIPELKFCFGLLDILDKERTDLLDKSLMKFTNGIDRASGSMIVLSFYFE